MEATLCQAERRFQQELVQLRFAMHLQYPEQAEQAVSGVALRTFDRHTHARSCSSLPNSCTQMIGNKKGSRLFIESN